MEEEKLRNLLYKFPPLDYQKKYLQTLDIFKRIKRRLMGKFRNNKELREVIKDTELFMSIYDYSDSLDDAFVFPERKIIVISHRLPLFPKNVIEGLLWHEFGHLILYYTDKSSWFNEESASKIIEKLFKNKVKLKKVKHPFYSHHTLQIYGVNWIWSV